MTSPALAMQAACGMSSLRDSVIHQEVGPAQHTCDKAQALCRGGPAVLDAYTNNGPAFVLGALAIAEAPGWVEQCIRAPAASCTLGCALMVAYGLLQLVSAAARDKATSVLTSADEHQLQWHLEVLQFLLACLLLSKDCVHPRQSVHHLS